MYRKYLENSRKEKYLHGIVNNAGIMATPFEKTVDSYVSQFQVRAVSKFAPCDVSLAINYIMWAVDKLHITLAFDQASNADHT